MTAKVGWLYAVRVFESKALLAYIILEKVEYTAFYMGFSLIHKSTLIGHNMYAVTGRLTVI